MDYTTLIITVVTAMLGSGAVSALVSGVMARRKTKAEAIVLERTTEQKAIELAEKTYKALIETLQNQIASQAKRITALEAETITQKEKIELLVKQLGQLQQVNASLLEKNSELQKRVK